MDFGDPELAATLDAADAAELDALPFGVVAMDATFVVVAYNRAESALSGLSPERVVGRNFFSEVAPCTANAMVAGRFDAPGALDVEVPYVFALRMRPTPVTLRLMRSPGGERQYLAVQRR